VRKALAGLLLVAACSAPARDATEVTIGGPTSAAPTATAARAVVPVDATLPKDAAAVLTVGMASLQLLFEAVFQSTDEGADRRDERTRGLRELETTLGLAKGSLAPERAFDTLGLDVSRAASIAIAPVSVSGRARIAALDALAKKPAPKPPLGSTLVEDVKAALGSEPATFRVRLVVPVKDGTAVKRAFRHALTEDHFRDVTPPPGVDLLLHNARMIVAASADDTWMVVDILESPSASKASAEEVVRAVAEMRAHAENGAAGLDLSGAEVRARIVPHAIAEIGFLEGVSMTSGAVFNVDPDQQVRIIAAGLAESHRALELAGNERGDFFTGIDIVGNLSKPLVIATATFGPGQDGQPKAALAVPRSAGVDGAGLNSLLDASLAAGLAFHLPGDGPNALATESEVTTKIREAGWSGWFVAGPLLPLLLMSAAVRPPPEAFSPKSAALRLERIAVVETGRGQGEIFVGVLRAGTSEAEAMCVLAGSAPCARRALKVSGPATKIGDKYARLGKVGDRFVVTIGSDATALEAYKPSLSASAGAPLRARLVVDALHSRLTALILAKRQLPTLVATGEVSETALTIRVEAAP
jgi:hypothetical protein